MALSCKLALSLALSWAKLDDFKANVDQLMRGNVPAALGTPKDKLNMWGFDV